MGRKRGALGGFGFNDLRVLLIIVVCGVIGIALTMMLNLAVANDILTLSEASLKQFSTITILMSLMLGTIIGVASSSRR